MIDLLIVLIGILIGIIIGGLLGYCSALNNAKAYMEQIDKRGGL